jgi:hypothetical protein
MFEALSECGREALAPPRFDGSLAFAEAFARVVGPRKLSR